MKILMVVYDNDAYISHFPLGIAYLAGACLEKKHHVEIYHQDIYHYPESHLTNKLNNEKYDMVLVSVIGGYYQYKKLKLISNAINESINRKHFTYLIGGHGPASAPEYYLKITDADFVGIGEGERTIIELLNCINIKGNFSEVDGIAFINDKGEFVQTNARQLVKDLDELPYPAWHLFNMDYYALQRFPNISKSDRSFAVLSGRGCTFECNFCFRLDKGFRPRKTESIIEEIKILKERYKITYIAFMDELLMNSKERVKDFCEKFIEADLNVKWDCNGRLNYADIDTLTLMKKAGCVFINYGIESLDNATLKVMNKALTKDIIIKGIENTLSVGISPGLNIIYGNINEPLSAIDEAVEFLLKYDDHAQLRTIRPVTPYPGSPLFDYAIKQGLLKDVKDFYENKHTNSDLLTVNFTQNTDEEIYEKLNWANKILINIYIEVQKEHMMKTCDKLYLTKDATFRGFRHT
ncbi:B12-binding domain-containing radical SAM protein [Candidatus Epulonipiscium fishelsonii]|uniref:B12-binding domain-containing radical SAM protein n=1 Tax=Candidatus Epulonipiscium fishelsonii TaxID=77094 RepID=A0ACC8XFU9_9FIRM|nr:B12-binding domain-containing radical SAM protein [Epulopiscium sp. SCG-B11WGA-EpuloA1]ONI42865.1 B12-binding domain-containing radical SAM protein [Epulopiscium sp. SCG-B05WGA-EpuloA1]